MISTLMCYKPIIAVKSLAIVGHFLVAPFIFVSAASFSQTSGRESFSITLSVIGPTDVLLI